jgi:hypothetical protein
LKVVAWKAGRLAVDLLTPSDRCKIVDFTLHRSLIRGAMLSRNCGMINFDARKDRSEINRELKLQSEAGASLWTRVDQIADEINRHEAAVAEIARGKDRRQVSRYIKSLSDQLKRLDKHLTARDANTDRILRSQLGSRLGELLSNQAFEQLTRQSPDYGVSSRFPPDRTDERDGGLFRAWDEEMLQRRVNIARHLGTARLLVALIRDLNRPLLRLLEVERANKGGAPSKAYRNYVISELVPLYRQLYNEEPTMTPNGKFAKLCSLVLDEIEIDTDGLDSAIARILNKLKTT